jgi:hypothetical protein
MLVSTRNDETVQASVCKLLAQLCEAISEISRHLFPSPAMSIFQNLFGDHAAAAYLSVDATIHHNSNVVAGAPANDWSATFDGRA